MMTFLPRVMDNNLHTAERHNPKKDGKKDSKRLTFEISRGLFLEYGHEII